MKIQFQNVLHTVRNKIKVSKYWIIHSFLCHSFVTIQYIKASNFRKTYSFISKLPNVLFFVVFGEFTASGESIQKLFTWQMNAFFKLTSSPSNLRLVYPQQSNKKTKIGVNQNKLNESRNWAAPLTNSPSVKFTFRMSHTGWVLQVFVRWCLHLFLQDIDPSGLYCCHKTIPPELNSSAALSSLKCARNPVKNAAWMKSFAITFASAWLHSEPQDVSGFKLLPRQCLESTYSAFNFLCFYIHCAQNIYSEICRAQYRP